MTLVTGIDFSCCGKLSPCSASFGRSRVSGKGIDQLAALLHHAYLYWDADEPTFEVPLNLVTTTPAPSEEHSVDPAPAYYAVMPEHRIWAEVIPGSAIRATRWMLRALVARWHA